MNSQVIIDSYSLKIRLKSYDKHPSQNIFLEVGLLYHSKIAFVFLLNYYCITCRPT